MDTSTAVFIATLALGFVVLRWLIAPIPPHLPSEIHSSSESSSTSSGRASRAHNRRPVTQSMIEVVQAVAPQLTVGQIRMDLERSGSVEVTIERFMENGTLPFPAGEDPSASTTTGGSSDNHNKKPDKTSELNLLVKYGIDADEEIDENDVAAAKDGYTLMAQRRKFMILNARKRMQQLLGES